MGAKSTAVEQKGAQPAPAAALRKPSPTSVEVHSRLSSALESLLVLAKRSMDQKVAQQVEQLLEETREVEQQQQALSTWTDADTLRSLRQERDALRRQLAASEEPRMLETLEEQRQAVIQRIEVMEEALATMQRLESREKTLLHQVEGIRLLLIKEGLSAEKLSDLGALLKEHSTRSLAREEVEESLARGRMEAKERTRS